MHSSPDDRLVLDKTDVRALIIDQSEENLDPRSIFDELGPHFREAGKPAFEDRAKR